MDIVLSLDGEEKKVSSDALRLPDGYAIVKSDDVVPRDQVRDNYVLKHEFDRRFKNWVPRDKAAEDEEVKRLVLAEQAPAPDLEAAKREWNDREREPLKRELQEVYRGLAQRDLLNETRGVFDDPFLAKPSATRPSWVEVTYGDQFAYDKDLGYTVALGSDGRPLASANPTATRPYKDVREFFTEAVQRDEALKPFLKPDPKNAGGSGHFDKPGGARTTPPKSRKAMTPQEKVAYAQEHGSQAFLALPE
jgi:hypothetical protein